MLRSPGQYARAAARRRGGEVVYSAVMLAVGGPRRLWTRVRATRPGGGGWNLRTAGVALAALVVLLTAGSGIAKSPTPPGIIAASVGEQVILVEPSGGGQVALPTGPVAWLFPAPGGVLFAPDLVHGRTTVVDLRTRRIRDRLDAITMPHFGTLADRYVAVVGDLLVMSFPERAVLNRVDAAIEHPWQVVISQDDATVLVLERRPDGSGGSALVGVNLSEHRVALRRALGADVTRMALSQQFGLLALAEPEEARVVLVEPGTVTPLAATGTEGAPVDVVFTDEGDQLVAAVRHEGASLLRRWRVRRHRGALRLEPHGELALPAAPVRMALGPGGSHLAVALADGTLDLVEVGPLRRLASYTLPGAPRDLRWCDPARPGPLLPEWSDTAPPELPPLGREQP